MSVQATTNQNEKTLGALAHGSILLGPLTNGVGGIIAALVIWAIHKEKSAYVAFQALQSLVYQAAALVVTTIAWCCWGVVWMLMFFPPMIARPEAYQAAPPPGLWLGMFLMIVPLAIWGLTILYGLWGAARCLGGHEFRYAIIANWLDR